MRGLTLIELMTALLIFSFVAAGAMKFLMLQMEWYSRARGIAEAQQESRIAMDTVVRELGLLGFGVPPEEPRLIKAELQEVEFLANLDHEFTRLISAEGAGARVLSVDGSRFRPGRDFEAGRTVSLCSSERCEWHILAGDATFSAMEMSEPIGGVFPAGSTVHGINRVRFALRPEGSGRFRLIRTKDGGANAVAEALTLFELSYFDREGRVSADKSDIRRVQIRMEAPAGPSGGLSRGMESSIWLRNSKEET